jgi:hypothetical protein
MSADSDTSNVARLLPVVKRRASAFLKNQSKLSRTRSLCRGRREMTPFGCPPTRRSPRAPSAAGP